ncbi:hypothetical protein CF319_g7001 [Tilletia indica]|nr:hypothetical protein CF319_g7001 [Tilletia indica]
MKLLTALQSQWYAHFLASGPPLPPSADDGTNNKDSSLSNSAGRRSGSRARTRLLSLPAVMSQSARTRSEPVCGTTVPPADCCVVRSSAPSSSQDTPSKGSGEDDVRRDIVFEIQRPPWRLSFPQPSVLQPQIPELVQSPAQITLPSATVESTPSTSPVMTLAPQVNRVEERYPPLETPSSLSSVPPPVVMGLNPLSKQFAETVSEVPSLYVGEGERPLSLRELEDLKQQRRDGPGIETLPVVAPDVALGPPLKLGSTPAIEVEVSQKVTVRANSVCTLPDLRSLTASAGQPSDLAGYKAASRRQGSGGSVGRNSNNVRFIVPVGQQVQPGVGEQQLPMPSFTRPTSPLLVFPRAQSPRPSLAEGPRSLTPPPNVINQIRTGSQRVRKGSNASVSSMGSNATHHTTQPTFHRPVAISAAYQPMHLGQIPSSPLSRSHMLSVDRPGSTPFPTAATSRAYPYDPRAMPNPYFPPASPVLYRPGSPLAASNLPSTPTRAEIYWPKPHVLPQVDLPIPSPLHLNMPAGPYHSPPSTNRGLGAMDGRPWPPGSPTASPFYPRTFGHSRSASEASHGTYQARPASPFTLNGSNWGSGGFQQAQQAGTYSRRGGLDELGRRTGNAERRSSVSSASSSKTGASGGSPVAQFFRRSPPKFGPARFTSTVPSPVRQKHHDNKENATQTPP